jgi:hypothetical protein
MSGLLLTKAGKTRSYNITKAYQLKMLAASAAGGIIAGIVTAYIRLHLGLPGHKVLFWLTPVIVVRLLSRCKAGATTGAFTAALTCFVLGGHLAGGIFGLPLIGFAGIILDVVINSLEKRRTSLFQAIVAISVTSMIANLLCFAKRLLVPAGPSPRFLFGQPGLWSNFFSYAFFGLSAGLIAVVFVWVTNRYKNRRRIK